MRAKTLGLVLIFANAAIAAVLAFARSKRARAATLEPLRRRETPAPGPAPKRWTVPPGFRALRASEITPTLRQVAADIAQTIGANAPGSWFPFELEGKHYGALRTKAAWRYYVQKTPEEAAEDIPAPVPLPEGLTH